MSARLRRVADVEGVSMSASDRAKWLAISLALAVIYAALALLPRKPTSPTRGHVE